MIFTSFDADIKPYDYHDHYPDFTPEYIKDTPANSTTSSSNLNLDTKPPTQGLPLWLLHLMAGGISGPVSRTVTAPIDRIRLTIQVSSTVDTVLQTIRKLIKDAGILGLWRGNLINVLKVTPEMSLRFAFYERVKQHIRVSQDTTSAHEKMIAGAIAGVLAQFTIYPLEVLKIRMTVRKTGQYDGLVDAIVKIYRREGKLAFYRGYCASVIGIIPYTAIDMAVFETLKHNIVYTENYMHSPKYIIVLKVLSCATIATSCGQAASYPLYLVKARQQAASTHATNTIVNKWRFCKLCQILYTIVKLEGVPGLYRGLMPSLVKVLPASAVNFAVYEYAHRKLIRRYGKAH